MDKMNHEERELYWSQMPTARLQKERDDIPRRLRNAETVGEHDQVRADYEAIVTQLQKRPLPADEVLPKEDLATLRQIARTPARLRGESKQRFLESRWGSLLTTAEKGAQLDLDMERAAAGDVVEFEAQVDGKVRKFRIAETMGAGAEDSRTGGWAAVTTERLQEEREVALGRLRGVDTEGERQALRDTYWSIEDELARRPLWGAEHLEGETLAAVALIVEVAPGQRSPEQQELLAKSLLALIANAARGHGLADKLEKASWGREVVLEFRLDRELRHCALVALPLEVSLAETAVDAL